MHKLWWMGPLRNANPQPGASGDQLPPTPTSVPPADDPEKTRLATELARARQENERLRQNVPPRQTEQPRPTPTNADLNKEFYKDAVTNSAAIADAVVNNRLQQANAASYDTLVAVAAQTARGTDPEDQALFDKYRTDIELKMATVEPQWRQNATVWRNAFIAVKGEKLPEIVAEARNKAPAVHISRENGPSAPSAPTPKASKVQLTAEEQRTADRFGMTPEEYSATRDKLNNSSELGELTKPNEFDGVLIMRTEDRRRQERAERIKHANAVK
jgi:hypothetical protein